MVIAMPVLTLEEMHEGEPLDVAAGVFAERNIGIAVAYAVDEALRVKREYQSNGPEPEEGGIAEIQTAEERQGQDYRLQHSPDFERPSIEVRAIARNRWRFGLPQPSQMRPPETMCRARDVAFRVGVRVMHSMAGGPRYRGSRSIEDREEDQHTLDDWI